MSSEGTCGSPRLWSTGDFTASRGEEELPVLDGERGPGPGSDGEDFDWRPDGVVDSPVTSLTCNSATLASSSRRIRSVGSTFGSVDGTDSDLSGEGPGHFKAGTGAGPGASHHLDEVFQEPLEEVALPPGPVALHARIVLRRPKAVHGPLRRALRQAPG